MGNRKSCLAPVVITDLMHNTDFTSAELKNLYKQYRQDCIQNGHGVKLTMTISEFQVMYEDIFPQGDSEKFGEHVFRTYDKSGKGVINFQEFITTLNLQLNGTYEDKLTWLFDLYDMDGSGEISYDETYELLNVMFDLNSGLIPDEENTSAKQLTEYLFSKANKHGRSTIDEQFFYNSAVQSKPLRNLLEATMKCANKPFLERKDQSKTRAQANRKSIHSESHTKETNIWVIPHKRGTFSSITHEKTYHPVLSNKVSILSKCIQQYESTRIEFSSR